MWVPNKIHSSSRIIFVNMYNKTNDKLLVVNAFICTSGGNFYHMSYSFDPNPYSGCDKTLRKQIVYFNFE